MNRDIFKNLEEIKKAEFADKNWLELNRQKLLAYVKTKPLIQAAKTKWQVSPVANLLKVFNGIGWKMAPVVLTVVLVLGGSLSAAARGAKPGDALYGWKININERLKAAMKLDVGSRADFEVMLAGERLRETTEVSASKNTGSKVLKETGTVLETQLQRAEKEISKLETINPDKALMTSIKFKAALNAHREILKRLEEKTTNGPKAQILTTIEAVDKTVAILNDKNAGIVQRKQDTINNEPAADAKAMTQNSYDAASGEIKNIADSISVASGSSDSLKEAQNQLSRANDILLTAKTELDNNDYQSAISHIQEATILASNADALINVEDKISGEVKNVLSPESNTPAPSAEPASNPTASPTSAPAKPVSQITPTPKPSIEVLPLETSGNIPFKVTLEATISNFTNCDAPLTWDFGDGTKLVTNPCKLGGNFTSNVISVSHTYNKEATYKVKVQTDVTAPKEVTVNAVIPLKPTIFYTDVISGPVGTRVMVIGKGFTLSNTVNFGISIIMDVSSADGKSLIFTVPQNITPSCVLMDPPCNPGIRPIITGEYRVSITNNLGTSNETGFIVTVDNQ
ncbi:MAG: hypothetical protein CEN90_546 [Parcubacteria group bacterium Licking1014_17]|nr:MAG: hypothetical protein CEN90_546 [Parcubacteria group bacterium Licking1014_17]